LFSKAVLLAYKKRIKAQQRSALKKIMEATDRVGLYDVERLAEQRWNEHVTRMPPKPPV